MITHADWIYIQNPFDTVTKTSYKKLDVIALDHLTKLKARQGDDPRIANLEQETGQKYQHFSSLYTQWQDINNVYNAATAKVDEKEKELAGEGSLMEGWDLRIQLKFRKNTTEYQKEFFPEGKDVYSKGSREGKIRALEILGEALNRYPTVSDVALEVKDYREQLQATREHQQKLEQEVQNHASKLRIARETLVKQLCYNKDMLLVINRDNRVEVLNYFQMNLIRKTGGVTSINTEVVNNELADTIIPDEKEEDLEAYLNDQEEE